LELANVARLCETGCAPGVIDALDRCLSLQADAVAQNDNARFQEQDDRFHRLLARATGFARAETVLVREKAALDRLRVLALSSVDHKARLLDEHRAIRNAIVSGDAVRTIAETRAHLRSILGALSRLIAENKDLFG
jgi:DNA-binding GntR family transcriptional regulator